MAYSAHFSQAYLCWEIFYGERHLATVETAQEARDYIGACKEHDAFVEERQRYLKSLEGFY